MEPCTFSPSPKNKKIHLEKISYTSGNGNPKNFLIFSQKKAVLMFWYVTFTARKMKKPTLKKLLIFQEMKLFNHKLKKLLFFSFFFRRTPYGFSSLFLQIFSFYHWFLLFLSGDLIADCICSLHHCFFKWFFYFTTDFTIAFLSVFISPTFFTMTVFFRCFVFVLLYRMCHGFERAFFTLSRCLLTLLPDIWHDLLLSMLPWCGQFCLEGCSAFNWGSKHRPGPSVCLNHTGFSKRY